LRHIFLFFLLFCVHAALQAQSLVTGYQGRRWYAEANLSAIPTLVGPSYDNFGVQRFQSSEPNIYDLSVRGGFDLYYVTNRYMTFFGGYEYARTGLLMQASSPSFALPDGVQTTNNDLHHLFYQMRSHSAQFGAEFYTDKSLLAPLGAYMRFSLQYNLFFADLRQRKTDFSSYYAGPRIRELGLNNLTTYEITPVFELGTRTVLANRITLSLGVRTHLPIMALSKFSFNDEETEPPLFSNNNAYQIHNLQVFEQAARRRMFLHGIFMLQTSVGFLF
jgi:hypothetical protein